LASALAVSLCKRARGVGEERERLSLSRAVEVDEIARDRLGVGEGAEPDRGGVADLRGASDHDGHRSDSRGGEEAEKHVADPPRDVLAAPDAREVDVDEAARAEVLDPTDDARIP